MTTKSSSTSSLSSSSSSCIVIEFGSSTIKVGIAGETQPRCIFPSFLISSSSSSNNNTNNNNTSCITSPPLPYTPSYEYKNHNNNNNHNNNHNDTNKDTHSYNQLYQQMSLFLHDLFTFHLYITHLHTKTSSSSSSSSSSSRLLKSPMKHNHKMKKILIILPHHTSLPKLQPLNHNTSSTSLSTIYTNIIQNILIHEIQITNYNNLKFVHNSIMDIIIPYTLGLSYGIVIDFGLNEIRIGCYCSSGGSSSGGGSSNGNYGSSYSSLEFINIGKDFIFKSIWNQIHDDDDDELEYNDDVMYVLEDIMKTMSSSSLSSYQSRTSTNVKQSTTTTTTSTTTTTTKIRNKILSKVSIEKIQEIISTTIHEYYFNIHNSNGLLYIFLKCILQYPIDVRSKVIRNICMVGGGMLWIQHDDFERRFLESIYNLFEQEVNDDNGKRYKMKNERYKKFDSLAMLFMVKGPLKIVYPLPFSPAIIGWVGGSVLGALDSTFDDGSNSLISDGDNDNVNYELMHLLG